MSGLDLSSAVSVVPAREPLAVEAMTVQSLSALGDRIARRTWEFGLPVWFWGEGVCLLGLVRLAEARGGEFPTDVRDWLNEQITAGVRVEHVNNVSPGTVAVLAAAALGPGQYLDVAERLAAWVEQHATRDPGGALEHWPGGVWADTTFMAGVFLGRLGAVTGRADLVAECGRQLLAHADLLQDDDTGLYAHGRHRGEWIPCFWGRGNAWCALAAVEFLELAEASGLAPEALVAAVRQRLVRQLQALAERQPDHGVWSVLVDDQPENAGIIETSAAAGIGAAMLRAAALPGGAPNQVTEAGWRAVRGALAYVDGEGTLTRVSAGTVLQLVPFGYSVIRDDRIQPWGQGLALHAAAAAIMAVREGRGPA